MSPGVAVGAAVAVLAASIASWWWTRWSGLRALAARERMFEGHSQRALDAARQAADAARQALERSAVAHAARIAELERTADQRAASAVREVTDRAETVRVMLHDRVARADGLRAAVAQQLADAEAAAQRKLAELEAAAQRKLAELEAARRMAASDAAAREQQLAADLVRWQARARSLAAVCQLDAVVAAPLYADRPSPGELDAIARRARGLAFVDCVTVGDPSGLPIERGGSRDADDLAALVPIVGRVASDIAGPLGAVRAVVLHTDDARVIELRSLPAWTAGAWLVAQASAQPPQPAALDAAVAYAHAVRDEELPERRPPRLIAHGRLGPGGVRRDALGDELEQATRGLGTRTVALALGDQVLAGVEADGVGIAVFAYLLRGLQALHQLARARLRALAVRRVEVDIAGGVRLALAPLGADSRLDLITITVGRPLDPLEVERVVGRLRRFLDGGGGLTAASAGHD